MFSATLTVLLVACICTSACLHAVRRSVVTDAFRLLAAKVQAVIASHLSRVLDVLFGSLCSMSIATVVVGTKQTPNEHAIVAKGGEEDDKLPPSLQCIMPPLHLQIQ